MKYCFLFSLCVLVLLSCKTQQNAQSFFNEGAKQLEKGEYIQAIELYQKGLDIDPKSAIGYNLVGMACRMQFNKTGDALWRHKEIISFNQALEIDPDYVPALINLGATYYYSGEKNKAVPYFKHALEVYPEHPEAREIRTMIAEGEAIKEVKFDE
ncbi:tetratricopeptide repeat protein [candidate division WOR-3 bacterium]|nr:tetratricopeptide repeat protein [candidate division WOR-3 bacterium]